MVGVILNLALWFAIHTLFRSVAPIATGPFRFDPPVFASPDRLASTLSAAAIVVVLRFKTGTLPTLAATSLAGVGLYLSGVIA